MINANVQYGDCLHKTSNLRVMFVGFSGSSFLDVEWDKFVKRNLLFELASQLTVKNVQVQTSIVEPFQGSKDRQNC